MKKNFSKLLLAFMATAAMALSFASCNEDDPDLEENKQPTIYQPIVQPEY